MEHRVRWMFHTTIRASDTVAFCHPRDTGGVFVEWFAAGHDIDPRFGAEIPQYLVPPALEVSHMAFAGAVVEDPLGLASRRAALLATTVTFTPRTRAPGPPGLLRWSTRGRACP
ncbi:MAG: hypothetical protein ABWY80_04630 [Acidimicrobiia bacterium]